jgi:hypothetical protein
VKGVQTGSVVRESSRIVHIVKCPTNISVPIKCIYQDRYDVLACHTRLADRTAEAASYVSPGLIIPRPTHFRLAVFLSLSRRTPAMMLRMNAAVQARRDNLKADE